MQGIGVGTLLGFAAGAAIWGATRLPLCAWIASAPLGLALIVCEPTEAGWAGALAGAIGGATGVARREFLSLLPLAVLPTALAGLLVGAAGAALLQRIGTGALLVVLPATMVLTFAPLRAMGAPRWVSNPLACTQERSLPMVHVARVGGDYMLTAVLALGGVPPSVAVSALLGREDPRNAVAVGAIAVGTVCVLRNLGARSVQRARPRQPRSLRVACVVADANLPRDAERRPTLAFDSEAARDVDAALSRYERHVREAIGRGAELVVLPEVAVTVGERTRGQWTDTIASWARSNRVAIVAPYFDRDVGVNTVAILDAAGDVHRYDKQHPARGMEPARRRRMPAGPYDVATRSGRVVVSVTICVDADYGDFVATVAANGGVLVVPSNDWFGGFERAHHRTAVWAAALTGAPLVRSTGHGISGIFDTTGRVVAEQSSEGGPVVLVADVVYDATPTQPGRGARG